MPALNRSRPALDAASVMSVLDVAYDVELSDARWLERICDTARPLLETDDAGVHAFYVDLSQPKPKLSTPLLKGGDGKWKRQWRTDWWEPFMLALDERAVRSILSFAPVSHATDLYMATRLQVPTLNALLQREQLFERNQPQLDNRFAYPDSLNLVAVDSGGIGLALVANRRTAALGPPSRHQRTVLGSLCAHLASAARLRRRLRAHTSLLDQSDAIVDERGKLVHLASDDAAASARRAVEQAAPQLKALRSKKARPGKADAQETLALWRALYAGRFSVLDVFTRDGKRYVVARRNEPGAPAAAKNPLSEDELKVLSLWSRGHANGQIAYELGVSGSTVAGRLASSSQKLETTSADELMTRARTLLDGGDS